MILIHNLKWFSSINLELFLVHSELLFEESLTTDGHFKLSSAFIKLLTMKNMEDDELRTGCGVCDGVSWRWGGCDWGGSGEDVVVWWCGGVVRVL